MRPSSTSHMCKAPNILQANSDDTVMSKMGVRRKFYKPSINPRQGFSPNNGGKSAQAREETTIPWKDAVANLVFNNSTQQHVANGGADIDAL